MSAFLTVAALLTLLALAFVLPPLLWRGAESDGSDSGQLNLAVLRDQLRELDADLASGMLAAVAYSGARLELERRVAEDVRAAPAPSDGATRRWQAGAVGVAIVLGAATLYAALGTPRALQPAPASAGKPMLDAQQAEAMVARLARHMQTDAGNVEGWLLLARSYTALKHFPEAGSAYARLLALTPNDPQALIGYADVLSVAQGRSLQGEPERLLRRALALEPDNVKVLILLGSAEFERGDLAAAIATWKAAAALVPPESDSGRLVAGNIADAEAARAASDKRGK